MYAQHRTTKYIYTDEIHDELMNRNLVTLNKAKSYQR